MISVENVLAIPKWNLESLESIRRPPKMPTVSARAPGGIMKLIMRSGELTYSKKLLSQIRYSRKAAAELLPTIPVIQNFCNSFSSGCLHKFPVKSTLMTI